jgi:hypothetical protein
MDSFKPGLLNKLSRYEDMCGRGGIVPLFLTSALDGGECSASPLLAALPPGKELPCTHWIRGCVDPRAGLDAVEKSDTF